MDQGKLKYIYGPVFSWRLGRSLGVDPLSDKSKICNMDCVYCQLGKTVIFSNERKIYVPTSEILKELKSLNSIQIDYITIAGRGEPTLALNMGEIIREIRKVRPEPIAVITSSILFSDDGTCGELALADYIIAKLDAGDPESFSAVDKAVHGISFHDTVEAIKRFRRNYSTRLAIQVMFIEANRHCAAGIAKIVREIDPDEVQIDTPLRPSSVRALTAVEIDKIMPHFQGLPVVSVFDRERKIIQPIEERSTIRRHGNYKKQK